MMKEKQKELINALDLQKYTIPTNPSDWDISERQTMKMSKTNDGVVSVKSVKKRKGTETAEEIYQQEMNLITNKHSSSIKDGKNTKGKDGKRRKH